MVWVRIKPPICKQQATLSKMQVLPSSECSLHQLNHVKQHMQNLETKVNPEYRPAPDGSTMKALAWFGTKDVRLVDAPVPSITEPDDVILKVTGTTICGSDLHLYGFTATSNVFSY